jgi:hypothetical protein
VHRERDKDRDREKTSDLGRGKKKKGTYDPEAVCRGYWTRRGRRADI